MNNLLSHRENLGRAEKITSITLDSSIDIETIKEITEEYKSTSGIDEKINTHNEGKGKFIVNVLGIQKSIIQKLDWSKEDQEKPK